MASNNSSKTAHVMNLLSKNRGPAAETPEEPQSAAPQAGTAPAAPVAPIISSINADAAVSSQIKDALEAELEDQPQAAPVRQAAPQAAAVPQTEAVPPASTTAEDLLKPGIPSEEHAFVNVMEVLVDEKADEYMKMFGICCCDKCRVDVRAYALNRLPPKYVVLSEHERVPRLTVYESRFASDITAQLIKACKQVMLTPHHTREGD